MRVSCSPAQRRLSEGEGRSLAAPGPRALPGRGYGNPVHFLPLRWALQEQTTALLRQMRKVWGLSWVPFPWGRVS